MKVLVVGASGQLGTAVVRELQQRGHEPVAMVRRPNRALQQMGVATRQADLRNPKTIRQACEGIDAIIATATMVVPRDDDGANTDELAAYRDLIAAAVQHQVAHFIYVSAHSGEADTGIPQFKVKTGIESAIREAEINHTIVRPTAFMDTYLPTIGSRLALVGAVNATLRRPSLVNRIYKTFAEGTIERFGIAVVPGNKTVKHAFIAADDVASMLAQAVSDPSMKNRSFDVTGPAEVSWEEVGQMLGASTTIAVPTWVLRSVARLTRNLVPSVANVFSILAGLAVPGCQVNTQCPGHPETSVEGWINTRRWLSDRQVANPRRFVKKMSATSNI